MSRLLRDRWTLFLVGPLVISIYMGWCPVAEQEANQRARQRAGVAAGRGACVRFSHHSADAAITSAAVAAARLTSRRTVLAQFIS